MKRSTKYTLKFVTESKKQLINQLFDLYSFYLQKTIDLLWNKEIPIKKNLSSKDISWMDNLGGQYKQLIYKHASETVRSCRFKKGKKSKPEVNNFTINFDNRMVKIEESGNSFDRWIRLRLPFLKEVKKNERIEILIPIKEHKHSLKFKDWNLANTIKLNRSYISLVFEKENPILKQEGKSLGIDIGYKKLIATSDNQLIGKDFEQIYEKISRKKQGSKLFRKALKERDNKINEVINKEINLLEVKQLIVEDLKSVKRKTKGKIRKSFNNKLQRWTYPKVISKLERKAEEEAVQFLRVPPAYTSQTCSSCGFRHKDNRKGEKFLCLSCGYSSDADINAAKTILHIGAYSPYAIQGNIFL